MEEKNDFANMTVDRTAIDGEPAPTDSPDRELLIFGEGGGSFTKSRKCQICTLISIMRPIFL